MDWVGERLVLKKAFEAPIDGFRGIGMTLSRNRRSW